MSTFFENIKKFFSSPQEEITPVKMPVIKLALSSFSIFIDNLKKSSQTIFIFTIFLTILSLITKTPYICVYAQNYEVAYDCADTWLPNILANIISMLAFVTFAVKYSSYVFQNEKFNLKKIFIPSLKELKSFIFLLFFMAINFLPLLSAYILYVRVPNPDWIVETFFFAVVSTGFLIPFFLMRFYSIFAFTLEGEALPPLKTIWQISVGNLFKILISVFIILLFIIVYMTNFQANFKPLANSASFYIVLILEVLYNFSTLAIFSFFINHCHTQKEILFGGEQHVLQ